MGRNIAFWLPDTYFWGNLVDAPHIGGREWCVVRVAEELSARGWAATISCPMPDVQIKNAVTYVPSIPHPNVADNDVVVALMDYDILRKLRHATKLIWVATGLPDLRPWRSLIDGVVVSSPAKGEALRAANPWLPEERVRSIFSGTDPSDYTSPTVERRTNRLLWCSSRDRGLHHLLRWWPRLRAARPDLELHVTYDPRCLDAFHWQHEMRAEVARLVDEGLRQPGVTDLGAVTREELVREQRECTLWACPVEFYGGFETGSFSIPEFCAAQTPMLLSADASLLELGHDVAYFLPFPIDDDQWIAAILDLLGNPEKRQRFAARQAEVAARYTWASAAAEWDALLTRLTPQSSPLLVGGAR